MLACPIPPVSAAEGITAQTAEQRVRDFYQWYFEQDGYPEDIEKNDAIYMFVARATVDAIRKENNREVVYFTQFGEMHSGWSDVRVLVHDATEMSGGIVVIPVTFDFSWGKHSVVVFMGKENNIFYIVKVIDAYPYS